MNIYEQKKTIENVLETLHVKKEKLVQSVKELSLYIDAEFFDISYEEDKKVSLLIQKRVDLFAKILIEDLKQKLEESENIEFKISKSNLEPYEAIAYVYGYKKDENEENTFTCKKSHINGFIENKNAFLIIIDIVNKSKIVPWKV